MLTLLRELAAPDCPKTDDQWDRCGVYYVAPIEGSRGPFSRRCGGVQATPHFITIQVRP